MVAAINGQQLYTGRLRHHWGTANE